MSGRLARAALAAAVAVELAQGAGCALSSKAAPIELRYFSPEPPEPPAGTERRSGGSGGSSSDSSEPGAAPAAARPRLHLGRVTPSAHLRYRIVRRSSPVERELSETLRWTEPPDAYVRRALTRALFEARSLEQVIGGPAPTLDVEVLAFEAVDRAPAPTVRGPARPATRAGRVELRYQLHDERTVLASGVVAVERDAGGREIERVVAAIGQAMAAATAEVADRVTRRVTPRIAP